jgi:hypothetical protein
VQRPKVLPVSRQIVFDEVAAGTTPPVQTWFPIGQSIGHQFIYDAVVGSSTPPQRAETCTTYPFGARRAGSPGHRRRREENMSAAHRPLTLWLVATLASINVHLATDSEQRPVVVVVLHNYAANRAGDSRACRARGRPHLRAAWIGVRWMATRR